MEVYSSYEISKAGYSKNCFKDKEPGDKKFGGILDEAMAGTSKTPAETAKPQMAAGIACMPCISSFSLQKNDVVERTEKLLNALDSYREKLQNPEIRLDDIQPLVNEMESVHKGLAPVLHSLPDGDGLKDILNEAMVASSVEAARFRRGDYA